MKISRSYVSRARGHLFRVSALDNSEELDIECARVVSDIMPSVQIDPKNNTAKRCLHLRELPFEEAFSNSVLILINCDVSGSTDWRTQIPVCRTNRFELGVVRAERHRRNHHELHCNGWHNLESSPKSIWQRIL